MYFKQCLLQKGNGFQHAWIPEKFAKLNQFVKLKQKDKTWDDGWQIINIGSRLPYEIIEVQKDEYRHHRKVTDK